jgi:hypothetical protein
MKTQLDPGEAVRKDGRANLQRGAETVGGHAWLTDRRLIFESHRFNIQTGATVIALADVAEVNRAWTKFLNLIPLAPNSVSVVTRDGREHRLVCSGPKKWIAAIEEQRAPAG